MRIFLILICFSNLLLLDFFSRENKIEFKYEDGFIIVDEIEINKTKINGGFLFDTGAQLTVVDSSLLEFIDYKEIGDLTSVDFLGNKKRVKKININSIKLGNNHMYDIDAFVMNLGVYGCSDFKGILGFNIIKKANWIIDFRRQVLKIIDISQSVNQDKSIKIPFKIKKNTAIINLKIGNNSFKTILDTGAKNELNLTLKDFEELKNKKELRDSVYRIELYSKSLNEKKLSKKTVLLSKAENISINDMLFEKKITFSGARTLGIDFFKSSELLILDFKENKILFKENKPQFYEPIVTKHGINFKKTDTGVLIVSYLRKKSVFDELGVEIGDKVLSVNNVDCYGLNNCDCKEYLNKEIIKDSLSVNFIRHKILSLYK